MLTVDEVLGTTEKEVMPKTLKPLRLVESQLEILELLYQFKMLRSNHIEMHLDRHYRGLRNSLTNLRDHGVIADHKQIYHNSIYWLTPKGKAALAGRDLPPRFVVTEDEFGLPTKNQFEHEMMAIDLLSNIKKGCDDKGIRMIPVETMIEKAAVGNPFVFPRKTENYVMKPDGAFGIHYPEGKVKYFAIEAEHNKAVTRHTDFKETRQQSSRKKMLNYLDVDWEQVYQNLNIGNMRVLFTAPTPTRVENIFTADKLPDSTRFLGHWIPTGNAPVVPQIIDAPWIRVGHDPEYINCI